MTKQIRVWLDTAQVIDLLSSALSQEEGRMVTYAEVVDKCVKGAFPDTYSAALNASKIASVEKNKTK